MKSSIILVGLAFVAQTAFAAGYEKSIMFGGQTSGVGGIAAPYIQGSQALYFNPAGLATDKVQQDVSLNISLVQSTFKGAFSATGAQQTSVSHLSTPVSLMYGKTLTDKLGVGAGVYTSAGNYADYTGLTFAPIKGEFEAKTDLMVTEFAVGAGYKVMDNLKVGLTYRVLMAKANLFLPIPQGSGLGSQVVQANLSDLKAMNYTGFKLGAQYKLGEKTDLGFTYRSEANFKAKGTQTNVVHTLASANAGSSSSDVTAGTTLPAAWTLGVKHACTDKWNSYAEYSFTEYSKVDNISLDTAPNNPILLKMKDQHAIRLGAEYNGYVVPIRFGILYGTQVTSTDHALPTSTAPGPSYVVTAGTGYGFGDFRVDGGLEYDWVNGTGNTNGTTNSASNQTTAYSLHLGGSYTF